jgi:Domain of unknown function (DUF4352)
MNRYKISYAVASVVLALGAIACAGGNSDGTSGDKAQVQGQPSTSASAAGPATAKVGQTVELTGGWFSDDTSVTVTLSNVKTQAKDGYGDKPDHGDLFLIVDVTEVCTKGNYFSTTANFKFVAKDGQASDASSMLGMKGELRSVDLAAGQKNSGKVVFEVPKDYALGKIQLEGVTGDGPAAFWTFK